MLNEYGARLDRNGYAPSIIGDHSEIECWNCGRNGTGDKLDRHEVFGGALRNKSKRLGLWVHLCHNRCHLDGVHKDADLNRLLRSVAQVHAMEKYGWTKEKFIEEFGRNYLED